MTLPTGVSMASATASGIEWHTGHRLDFERAQLHRVADSNLSEVGLAQDAVLFQLWLDQAQRQPRPVNRHVELFQNIWQSANVVFVTVAQKDAEHVLASIEQIRDVGEDKVDAQHVLVRKHQSRVDDEDLLLPLEGPHVDADLAQAAQRQISESRGAHSRRSCSTSCFGGGVGSGGGGGASSLSR